MDPNPAIYNTLDELVQELVRQRKYELVHKSLADLYAETDTVVSCVSRIQDFIDRLQDPAQKLDETWVRDRVHQVLLLREGCDELIVVALKILPGRAIQIISPHLT